MAPSSPMMRYSTYTRKYTYEYAVLQVSAERQGAGERGSREVAPCKADEARDSEA